MPDVELGRLIGGEPIKAVTPSSHGKSKTVGTYLLEHVPTGNVYVGSTQDLYYRVNAHFNALKRNDHRNENLTEAWMTEPDFKVRMFAQPSLKEARAAEQRALDKLMEQGKALNIATDVNASRKGVIASPELREKLSNAHKGIPLSAEHKAAMSKAQIGRVVTSETAAKISKALTGKSLPEDVRLKLSIANTGKKHTPEQTEKKYA